MDLLNTSILTASINVENDKLIIEQQDNNDITTFNFNEVVTKIESIITANHDVIIAYIQPFLTQCPIIKNFGVRDIPPISISLNNNDDLQLIQSIFSRLTTVSRKRHTLCEMINRNKDCRIKLINIALGDENNILLTFNICCRISNE
jgi:hypothetical protein